VRAACVATRPRRQPSFAGRGPKGYRRSDDRVREDVRAALTDDAAIDASDVTVQVQNSDVTRLSRRQPAASTSTGIGSA